MEPWEEIPAGLLAGLQYPSLERNDLTYEYLEAGARLLVSELNAPLADSDKHEFLSWLSRASVISEVSKSHLNGGDGSFRYRWPTQPEYLRDLIAYVRWRRTESVLPLREPDRIQDALASPAPSEAIQSVTRMNLEGLFDNAHFPLQLVALAIVGSTPDAEATPDFYVEAAQSWSAIIEAFFERYELSLGEEIELEDLVEILIAVGDGLALRELADPSTGARRAKRLTMQGIAAMALLLSFIADDDPGSIAERTDNLRRD